MQKIFISYSHKDEVFKNELDKHLSGLKRNKRIDSWTDRRIMPGDEWKGIISDELLQADIILLLVSADFLSSNYCYDIEMVAALERHQSRSAVVIPIFLRFCDWIESPFAKLQGLPKDAMPIAEWKSHDAAYMNIIEGIKKVLIDKTSMLKIENKTLSESKVSSSAIKTFEKDGNIYASFDDGKHIQLTYSKTDRLPLLISEGNDVLFIRTTYGNVTYKYVEKIMRVSVISLFEQTITKTKPYKDALYSTNFIHQITTATLSSDEKYLYFLVEAYVTSSNLVKVDIQTGEWKIISDAMFFNLIKTGRYAGLILIGKSEIKDRARDIYYYLVDEHKEILKEFDTRENFEAFRKSVIG